MPTASGLPGSRGILQRWPYDEIERVEFAPGESRGDFDMQGTYNFQKLPNYFSDRANTTGDGMLGRGFPGICFVDRGRANARQPLDLLMPGQLGDSSRDIA